MNFELRLVHVTSIPAFLGFLRGQPRELSRLGVTVFAISSPGELLTRFGELEGVAVEAVEIPREIVPLRDVVALWRLWRKLERLRPAIVDAHTPKAGLLGMAAATLARTPVRVYHLHGLRFATARGWKRAILRWAERLACALADRVLAVSPSLRALAVAEDVCPPEKIRVLGAGTVNGVDAAGRFQPQPEAVRRAARAELGIPSGALAVGFVGRLVRDKGMAELAEAWHTLRADPALHLLIVGAEDATDPPPVGVLEALRADLRVHFTGFDLDLPRRYAAMDVLALPTHREGFGQVALEAAAMALPVVATRVTGCVDAVVDGVTGTLVPPADAGALAGAVRRYLDDAALRERHGRAARRRALAEFRPGDLCAALASEYAELLGRRRSAGWPHSGAQLM